MKLLTLNHYWRIIAAGICYLVFALGAFVPVLYLLVLIVLPLDAGSKQLKIRKAIQCLCLFYIKFIQCLGLMTYRVQNIENAAVSGHLVIANHSSLIDALFALAYIDNLCCVVKHQLYHNPFTRLPVKLAGYISNNSDDFIQQVCGKLELNENVLIFPEGTRNHYDTQLDFKRGAANIAIISNVPVLPLVILFSPRALQKGQHWYYLPSKKSRILLQINAPLISRDCIDISLPRTLQYRRLNDYWIDYYRTKINNVEP